MKAAGVSSEEEFLQKYPTEEAFFAEFTEFAPQNNKAVSRVNTKSVLDNYLKGIKTANATSADKNAELEKDEYLNDAEGVHKMQGDTHEDGGIAMNLNEGDRILSDEGKPNKKYRKALEEKYGIKIKEGDTFAKILDRVNGKIGFKNVQEGERDLIKKAEKNQDVKDEATRVMNEKLLADKASILEKVKNFKNAKKQEAFDTLYAVQEDQKPVSKELENGVYVDEETGMQVKFEDGGMMWRKSDLPHIIRLKHQNSLKDDASVKEHLMQKMRDGGMAVKKYDEGGKKGKVTLTKLQKDRKYGLAALTEYVNSKSDRPDYAYGDLENTYKRGKYLSDQRDIKYDDINPKDLNSQGMMFGRTQKYDFQYTPNLAIDYGLDAPLTKNGVVAFLENESLSSKLKKQNPALYDKLSKTGRGMLENKYSEAENKEVSDLVKSEGDDNFKANFAKSNYNDASLTPNNKGYFRGIDKNDFYFTDKDEFDKFKADNKDKFVDGYYKTGKSGIYVKPILLQDKEFNTEEEKQAWLKDRKADKLHGEHFYDEADIAYTPIVKGQESAATKGDVLSNLSPTDEGEQQKTLPNPRHRFPGQLAIPPSALQLPMLINPQVRDQTFIKVSPEEAIRENNRAMAFMADQLNNTNNGLQASEFANIAGKLFEGNNAAINTANMFNAQQRANYDNVQTQRQDAYDAMRQQALSQYVDASQRAEQNTFNDWRNYFHTRDDRERQAFKDAMAMDQAEALTPTQNYNFRNGQYESLAPNLGSETKMYQQSNWKNLTSSDRANALKKWQDAQKLASESDKNGMKNLIQNDQFYANLQNYLMNQGLIKKP